MPGAFAVDMAVRSANAQTSEIRSAVVKNVQFHRFIRVEDHKEKEIKISTALISENREGRDYRVEMRADIVHPTGLILKPDVLHYACHVSLGRLERNISTERRPLDDCPRFVTVPDPYLDSQSPVSLRGVFRCMSDIRIGKRMRSARFILESELPPELSQSSIPRILLDALCRLSMMCVGEGGKLPICVPLRCSQILVAAGTSDHCMIGTRVDLRAAAPRADGEMMVNSYAEASAPNGQVLLIVRDLVARNIGTVGV